MSKIVADSSLFTVVFPLSISLLLVFQQYGKTGNARRNVRFRFLDIRSQSFAQNVFRGSKSKV